MRKELINVNLDIDISINFIQIKLLIHFIFSDEKVSF